MISNKYEKLDPALTRPGRVDITHSLTNASHQTIKELYYHLYNDNINEELLYKTAEYHFSPAELINIYIKNKEPYKFIENLIIDVNI